MHFTNCFLGVFFAQEVPHRVQLRYDILDTQDSPGMFCSIDLM